MDLLRPPPWLQNHPELKARGINLVAPLKPLCAWETDPFLDEPRYAVKIVPSGSQEADIYDQLHRLDPASPNHTLPCTIVRGEVRFLIMPCLEHILARPDRLELGLSAMLRLFRQVLEGIELLHDNNIVHLDLYISQLVIATECDVPDHPQVEAGKVYIIDFGDSKRLERGPGCQPAVDLPKTFYKHPLAMTRFDPYSWDMYCTGMLLQELLQRSFWIARRYAAWLVGKERGCTGVCHCRPSARRARQVLAALHGAVFVWDCFAKVVDYARDLFRIRVRPD
ncbi:hypothetical protein C8Q76DRAFT_769453 [Earliella scabrosa]|nr:hypothetical protein C8Q76DRAFT_769453 [Earliella scabrosa]